jgi:hypothetical protein
LIEFVSNAFCETTRKYRAFLTKRVLDCARHMEEKQIRYIRLGKLKNKYTRRLFLIDMIFTF